MVDTDLLTPIGGLTLSLAISLCGYCFGLRFFFLILHTQHVRSRVETVAMDFASKAAVCLTHALKQL